MNRLTDRICLSCNAEAPADSSLFLHNALCSYLDEIRRTTRELQEYDFEMDSQDFADEYARCFLCDSADIKTGTEDDEDGTFLFWFCRNCGTSSLPFKEEEDLCQEPTKNTSPSTSAPILAWTVGLMTCEHWNSIMSEALRQPTSPSSCLLEALNDWVTRSGSARSGAATVTASDIVKPELPESSANSLFPEANGPLLSGTPALRFRGFRGKSSHDFDEVSPTSDSDETTYEVMEGVSSDVRKSSQMTQNLADALTDPEMLAYYLDENAGRLSLWFRARPVPVTVYTPGGDSMSQELEWRGKIIMPEPADSDGPDRFINFSKLYTSMKPFTVEEPTTEALDAARERVVESVAAYIDQQAIEAFLDRMRPVEEYPLAAWMKELCTYPYQEAFIDSLTKADIERITDTGSVPEPDEECPACDMQARPVNRCAAHQMLANAAYRDITEGKVKKGGQNDPPTTPRPPAPEGQAVKPQRWPLYHEPKDVPSVVDTLLYALGAEDDLPGGVGTGCDDLEPEDEPETPDEYYQFCPDYDPDEDPDEAWLQHDPDVCPDGVDCDLHSEYQAGCPAEANAACMHLVPESEPETEPCCVGYNLGALGRVCSRCDNTGTRRVAHPIHAEAQDAATCQCDEEELSCGDYSDDCPRHKGEPYPGDKDHVLLIDRNEHVDPKEGPMDLYIDGCLNVYGMKAGQIIRVRTWVLTQMYGFDGTLDIEFRPQAGARPHSIHCPDMPRGYATPMSWQGSRNCTCVDNDKWVICVECGHNSADHFPTNIRACMYQDFGVFCPCVAFVDPEERGGPDDVVTEVDDGDGDDPNHPRRVDTFGELPGCEECGCVFYHAFDCSESEPEEEELPVHGNFRCPRGVCPACEKLFQQEDADRSNESSVLEVVHCLYDLPDDFELAPVRTEDRCPLCGSEHYHIPTCAISRLHNFDTSGEWPGTEEEDDEPILCVCGHAGTEHDYDGCNYRKDFPYQACGCGSYRPPGHDDLKSVWFDDVPGAELPEVDLAHDDSCPCNRCFQEYEAEERRALDRAMDKALGRRLEPRVEFHPVYIPGADGPCPDCGQTIWHSYRCMSIAASRARLLFLLDKDTTPEAIAEAEDNDTSPIFTEPEEDDVPLLSKRDFIEILDETVDHWLDGDLAVKTWPIDPMEYQPPEDEIEPSRCVRTMPVPRVPDSWTFGAPVAEQSMTVTKEEIKPLCVCGHDKAKHDGNDRCVIWLPITEEPGHRTCPCTQYWPDDGSWKDELMGLNHVECTGEDDCAVCELFRAFERAGPAIAKVVLPEEDDEPGDLCRHCDHPRDVHIPVCDWRERPGTTPGHGAGRDNWPCGCVEFREPWPPPDQCIECIPAYCQYPTCPMCKAFRNAVPPMVAMNPSIHPDPEVTDYAPQLKNRLTVNLPRFNDDPECECGALFSEHPDSGRCPYNPGLYYWPKKVLNPSFDIIPPVKADPPLTHTMHGEIACSEDDDCLPCAELRRWGFDTTPKVTLPLLPTPGDEYCDDCGMIAVEPILVPAYDECKCDYKDPREEIMPPYPYLTPKSKMTPLDFLRSVWQHVHWLGLAVPTTWHVFKQRHLIRNDPYDKAEGLRLLAGHAPITIDGGIVTADFSDIKSWTVAHVSTFVLPAEKEVDDLSDMY